MYSIHTLNNETISKGRVCIKNTIRPNGLDGKTNKQENCEQSTTQKKIRVALLLL